MPERLRFLDPESARDALTFAGRGERAGADGVRLQARGGVLAWTSAPLAPQGLLDRTPTVLAMRVLAVDPELECDLVVDALRETEDVLALALPETAVAPAWAGVAPPRGGWSVAGEVSATALSERAQWGISAVARQLPTDPGEDVVRTVRGAIWGEPDDDLRGLPRGVAFAAHAFGFLAGDETAAVTESGRWTRLTLARGHVLSRGPAASGLTDVRATG